MGELLKMIDEAVAMAVSKQIEEQDQNFFCEGIKTLQQRVERVLISKGISFKNKRF